MFTAAGGCLNRFLGRSDLFRMRMLSLIIWAGKRLLSWKLIQLFSTELQMVSTGACTRARKMIKSEEGKIHSNFEYLYSLLWLNMVWLKIIESCYNIIGMVEVLYGQRNAITKKSYNDWKSTLCSEVKTFLTCMVEDLSFTVLWLNVVGGWISSLPSAWLVCMICLNNLFEFFLRKLEFYGWTRSLGGPLGPNF